MVVVIGAARTVAISQCTPPARGGARGGGSKRLLPPHLTSTLAGEVIMRLLRSGSTLELAMIKKNYATGTHPKLLYYCAY